MLSIMIWEFIQNQILGMKWMSTLIGNLLEKIGLDTSSRMGGSVQFFLYDVLKKYGYVFEKNLFSKESQRISKTTFFSL